jgi:two-component system, NarL family, nitrate/nitrite response regulator NarL
MTDTRASVIVVDDHAIFRMGVVQTLAMSSDVVVIGEGGTRDEALELVERLSPDIALLDISMPGSGIDAAREIVGRWPGTRAVLLTVSEEDEDVFRAVDLGASGYILKGISANDLVQAVEAVAKGENFVSPSLGLKLISSIRRRDENQVSAAKISPQELNVLNHLTSGRTNAEIARLMGISIKTVKFHFTNLFNKTGTKSRVELALRAADLIKSAERA